jgi:hypothetical protein
MSFWSVFRKFLRGKKFHPKKYILFESPLHGEHFGIFFTVHDFLIFLLDLDSGEFFGQMWSQERFQEFLKFYCEHLRASYILCYRNYLS